MFQSVVIVAVLAAQFGLAFAAYAAESIPGVDSRYATVTVGDGATLTSIVAVPAGTLEALHPLLFTQWVSCGSIEYRAGSNSRELLARLAQRSGLALLRVERSAVDDSGPACAKLDYDTELAHYVEAYSQLLERDDIDASKVYVYGSSLGSTTAPLVALALQDKGYDIAGIMVSGGGAVTYLERMLNFDRIYLERRPDDVAPGDIHAEVLQRNRFQYQYLVRGRHPDAVAKDSESMARVRGDTRGLGESDHYGRPYAWHQQAARHNFLHAWAKLDAAVLVIFNAFDQFETRHGHRLIVDTVNRLRPGTATFVERDNIGHNDNRYDTILEAYAGDGGEPAWGGSATVMLEWLATITP